MADNYGVSTAENHAKQNPRFGAVYCLPDNKWSPLYYWTYRGAENFHVIVWLLKDIFWNSGYYIPGEVFGSIALFWSFVLLLRCIYYKALGETMVILCQTLWLISNNVWMYGELKDLHEIGEWGDLYERCTHIAGTIMFVALGIFIFFYMFLRPSRWLENDRRNKLVVGYNEIGFPTRLPAVFKDWREYENIHIFFWLGKDCAWIHIYPVMWIIFVIPTMVLAIDFMWVSAHYKGVLVEHMHYWAYFFWILGNSLWAMGDIFFAEDETALVPAFHVPGSWDNMRWWGGVSFLVAFIPLIILYAVWIPATLMGKIREGPDKHAGNNDYDVQVVSLGGLSVIGTQRGSSSDESSNGGKDKESLTLDVERGEVISVTDALDSRSN